jgi:hypothetical protein
MKEIPLTTGHVALWNNLHTILEYNITYFKVAGGNKIIVIAVSCCNANAGWQPTFEDSRYGFCSDELLLDFFFT